MSYLILISVLAGLLSGERSETLTAQVDYSAIVEYTGRNLWASSADQSLQITLPFEIKDGYHIQSDRPDDVNLIATEMSFEENPYVEFGTPEFTEPSNYWITGYDNPMSVFSDELSVAIPLEVGPQVIPGLYRIDVQLKYQPCTDSSCLLPRVLDLTLFVEVVSTSVTRS